MARIKYNVITHGVSGKLGDLVVFMQRYGKTFIGKIPSRTNVVTEDQLKVREAFGKAVKYAKAAMKNQALRTMYEQRAEGGVTAFNLAFVDFYKPPVIDEINTSAYTGIAGSLIKVKATDDNLVTGVELTVIGSGGNVLETGAAMLNADGEWEYATRFGNPDLADTQIKVVAKDHPGNMTEMVKDL